MADGRCKFRQKITSCYLVTFVNNNVMKLPLLLVKNIDKAAGCERDLNDVCKYSAVLALSKLRGFRLSIYRHVQAGSDVVLSSASPGWR